MITPLLTCTLALAFPPDAPRPFPVSAAIQAEWQRRAELPPSSAVSGKDRARLELSRARIGAPGSEGTVPPDQAAPTEAAWIARARVARSPQERFNALYWLNRVKSKAALLALQGLKAEDAQAWPFGLHLEGPLATARLNGAPQDPGLAPFLEAMERAGKVDPVRAQAARLRLVIAGLETSLLPPIQDSARARATLLETLGRVPLEARKAWLKGVSIDDPAALGLRGDGPTRWSPQEQAWILSSFLAAVGPTAPWTEEKALQRLWEPVLASGSPNLLRNFLEAVKDAEGPGAAAFAATLPPHLTRPIQKAWLLPALRKHQPRAADTLREELLWGADATARAAALEDLPTRPEGAAWERLHRLVWEAADLDPREALIAALERWPMTPTQRIDLLRPWLGHPDWTSRYQAFLALRKLDPATPWPTAPQPNAREKALLALATRLAEAGKPVRLRFSFDGGRTLTLRLDPTLAPINVANLVTLVRKGFYNGRRIGRVVPDFVVQLGSPYDTLDGGPGHSVRCENSPTWYGPGSVGMALSGKDTGGSQFFITTQAHPILDGKYTWMGTVEDPERALPLLDALALETCILKVEVR